MTETKEKQSIWPMLQAIFSGCTLLLLIALAVYAALGIQSLQSSLQLIEADIQQIEMDEVNTAVLALTDAANQLSAVDVDGLNKTAKSLKDAADTLSGVEIDEINTAIKSLTSAADNLSKIDITQLNAMVQSLSTVAERLNNITSSLSRLFGGS